ncbi:hypothetical protein KCU95_g18988, partial [Aureobasidium melanogenum]
MAGAPADCPDCRPGQPNGRCPKHKKYNPGRNQRKKDKAKRKVLFQPVDARPSAVNQLKQKEAKKVEKDLKATLEGVDRFLNRSDVERVLTPAFKAIIGSISALSSLNSRTTPPAATTGGPSSSSDGSSSDDSDNESDSDESDYAYSDFGDESDGSYEEDIDADDDSEAGDDVEVVDQDKQSIIDVDAEPAATEKKKKEIYDQEQEEKLARQLILLYANVRRANSLGVFAESCLDVEERFCQEAEQFGVPVTRIAMLQDVLTHAMYLQDYLALQPSSGDIGLACWLSDNTIYNMVKLCTRSTFVEGSEFLDPIIIGSVLPQSGTPEQTLIQLNNFIDNQINVPFGLKETTTRVVAVLSFPQHWTMFGIDSTTSTITFVDSLPDGERKEYAEKNVVCPTPARQANMNDCGVFSAHNAISYMNGEKFYTTSNTKEALEFAIRIRWKFQEAIRGLLLGTEGPNKRSEAALSGNGILPDHDAVNRAQARIDALSKVIHKGIPEKTKKETLKKHKAGNRTVDQTANDRRLSKRQKKIVSPKSFLPSCISGIRDLIFRLLSSPKNRTGMTVKEMEGPIREMMEHEKFPVPEKWNLIRLLRVILDRQSHHFQQDTNEKDRWVATMIPARELSARCLNELRAKRCSPTPSPLENPAMLHIFISRYSDVVSEIQHEKLNETYEARIKATNALFGAQKQQPETKPYVQGSSEYPMHMRCTLPNIQGTESLRDMLLPQQECAAALQELSEHAQRTIEDDPISESQFTYRIIISGLDGGSVNNDSWEDMKRAYPRLRGQLLICNDRGIPDPEHPVVTQKSMSDWATPACLLPKPQRKEGNHKHVIWGMFDIAMLANEWTRRSWAPAPRVAGPRQAKIEHDQQLLACRKLLLSNSLMYYHRIDLSIAGLRMTEEFTDPSFVIAQTRNGNVSKGRNNFVVDRCVPELEPFARVCRWGAHEPIDTWALSVKPPQDDEPLHGFYCDRAACYVLEVEECRHAEATRRVTLKKSSLDSHAESRTQKSNVSPG